jgi:hypothetical protein
MTGTRDALLAAQRGARDREAELYAVVTDEPVPADGRYRVKDHIAHLAAWRRRAAGVLRGQGEQVADIDAWNARVHESTQAQPAAQVVEEARASWADLISAVEAMTEEELHRPHPFNPDLELWVVVFANGDKHFEEHAGYIAELRSGQA